MSFAVFFCRTNSSQRLSSCGGSSVEQPLVHQTRHSPGHQTGRQPRVSLHSHVQFRQRYEELHLILIRTDFKLLNTTLHRCLRLNLRF